MVRMRLTILCLLSMTFMSPVVASGPIDSSGFAINADGAAYADIADLVTISPMILDVQIRKVQKLQAEQTVNVPPNLQRAVVTADVLALIRGSSGVAARVKFLLDIPRDSRGKIPKLKKQRFFLLGAGVTGRPDMVKLSRPDALVAYSATNDQLVRKITREAVQLDAPPAVAGIASAFFSAGTVLGEGNTQIFLHAANNSPFSISVTSLAGKPKIWTVSTSELIEEGAATPKRHTLMWYRLACGLPRTLSAEQVESGDGENAARAQADYRYVIDALGPCGRKR